MSVVWEKGMRICISLIYVCCFWEGNAHMHFVDLCVLFGGRECAYAFRLISALSFYVCCFGGKGMRRCIPLISALSFYVCCFGGKGRRRCIPLISALSFYVCCFGGRECADAFR